ncbi:hypothetical protein ASPTUDRAFT_53702 [Aspergillus tubingensis CBS 134.48]|uniref:Uncharacterized protein n=1 Tax=Aspergillus tubingensis (strain CBS 134.48) TaxID=767770 RepID=A0A1L9NB74_ASPTC|nr:hypothetical protein ASPTUDRAFT_53702 [Aspergillus tubingensis CBS 134.48]
MDRTRPDQIINDPVMGAMNYSLKSGQVACEWSVKDAASPNGVVLEVGAACPWPGRLSVQTGTRPRIAGEALAVTARTKCSHQTKSLGRRDGGLQSFFPRALVSRSLMAQMFRARRYATGWNIDAQVSQKLELKRRGEPGAIHPSIHSPNAFFLSVH